MKKKLVYVLAASQNIVFAAGNVALGLNKYMPKKEFDIIIYHNGISEQAEKALLKIDRVIIKQFKFPSGFEDAMMAKIEGRFKGKNALMAFCHYQIFDLLNQYETAIWLDVDMSIQADISALSEYGSMGMAPDMHTYGRFSRQINFSKPLTGYNMDEPSFCSSVIVVNDRLIHHERIYNWLWEKSVEYASYLANADQGILNIVIEEFDIKVNPIPWEEYECFASFEKANVARIVHFGYIKKVWNDSLLLRAFPEWYRTHIEWLRLGGTDFDRENMDTRNILFNSEVVLPDKDECDKAKKYPKWLAILICLFIPKSENRKHFRAKHMRNK